MTEPEECGFKAMSKIAFTNYIYKEGIPIYNVVEFNYTIPIYEAMERGINLIGNYFVIDYDGRKKKAFLITKEWIERENRLFTLDFISHHKAVLGVTFT